MAKLHAYYVTNAKAELKYVYQGLSEEKFYEEVEKNLSEYLAEDDIVEVEDDFDYDDDEDEDEDEGENGTNNNNGRIDEYLNLASEELRRLLEVQVVEVYIEKQPVDHGEKDFDINALLQEQFGDN
jgi:sulfite reductase beta subunit-like hemoprotein